MKNHRHYTTTNCSNCGNEVRVRRKYLEKNKYFHCKKECYLANRSKITQEWLEKKWNEKYRRALGRMQGSML